METQEYTGRSDDPPNSDYSELRGRRSSTLDTYTKWIVGIVGAGIISSLSFLVIRDRMAVDDSLNKLDNQVTITSSQLVNHETQIQVINAKQERVLSDLKDIQEAVKDNNEKIDRVLFEIRKLK